MLFSDRGNAEHLSSHFGVIKPNTCQRAGRAGGREGRPNTSSRTPQFGHLSTHLLRLSLQRCQHICTAFPCTPTGIHPCRAPAGPRRAIGERVNRGPSSKELKWQFQLSGFRCGAECCMGAPRGHDFLFAPLGAVCGVDPLLVTVLDPPTSGRFAKMTASIHVRR